MAKLKHWHLAAATAIPISIVLISIALVTMRKPAPGLSALAGKEAIEAAHKDHSSNADHSRLAVTSEQFDGMSKLLDGLGERYRHESIDEKVIRDSKTSQKYGAIFLTCAEGGAEDFALGQGLREFVSGGGTLYASDLRYDVVAEAFPEFVDPASRAQGLRQEVRAVVASPELRTVVGSEMPLRFELDGWRPAAFRGEDVSVLLKGRFRTTAGVTIEAPLLVKFPFGKGTVIFTSFHNEKKNSKAEIKLLNYLALRTIPSWPISVARFPTFRL